MAVRAGHSIMILLWSTWFFVVYTTCELAWVVADDQPVRSPKVDWDIAGCLVQFNEPCYSNKHIVFYLYLRGEGPIPTVVDLRTKTLPRRFNASIPLKVIVHGFGGSLFLQNVLEEYVNDGSFNVLFVDWSALTMRPCYVTAYLNTWHVGKCTGIAVGLLKTKNVHAVGFSLGAHAASYASNHHEVHYGRPFERITGLDPALPFFATKIPSYKLDPSDALFVDVIHTNQGIFGKVEPSGHIDFYVNNGIFQPGCLSSWNPPLCSHVFATELFADSISRESPKIWGSQCSSFLRYALGQCQYQPENVEGRALLGENVNLRGLFIVMTNKDPPYGINFNRVDAP